MRYRTLLTLILLFGFSANSSQAYPCKGSSALLIYQDRACEWHAAGMPIKTGLGQQQELTGNQLDETMWVLLEEPYKSDDIQFIEYVRKNELIDKRDSDGDTVLSIAALNGQTAVIDYLVANGIDIDSTNKRGDTVFDHAIKLDKRVKTALLRHGADINHTGADGRTPLINAIMSDDLAAVNFLLAHGADLDHIDNSGAHALQYAAFMGNVEIVKSLLESITKAKVDESSEPL